MHRERERERERERQALLLWRESQLPIFKEVTIAVVRRIQNRFYYYY
jgi:hypothetical protein